MCQWLVSWPWSDSLIMIGRRSPLRPTKKFPLPTWLMVVIFLNIFSIIGFLVLLPNPDSSPVVPTRLPHPNNGTIYLCWIGKLSHESGTIQPTALLSTILLYHPTRPLVIFSSSEHIPVDTGAEYDISIIPSPDLLDFETFRACAAVVAANRRLSILWPSHMDKIIRSPTCAFPCLN